MRHYFYTCLWPEHLSSIPNARRWYLLSLVPRDTLEILLHKKYGEEPSALLMPE